MLELAAGTGVTSVTAGMFASAVTATDVDRGEGTEGDDKQSHVVCQCFNLLQEIFCHFWRETNVLTAELWKSVILQF